MLFTMEISFSSTEFLTSTPIEQSNVSDDASVKISGTSDDGAASVSVSGGSDEAVESVSVSGGSDGAVESASVSGSSVEFEFVPGKRIGSKLLFTRADKRLFSKHSVKSDSTAYRCVENKRQKCPAYAYLTADGICTRNSREHTCCEQTDQVESMRVIESMKQSVLEDRTTNYRAIFNKIIAE